MSVTTKERCISECQRAKELIIEHKLKVASGVAALTAILLVSVLLSGSSGARNGGTAGTSCENQESPSISVPDTCPWQMVMSDVTHRVRLLEMAFKEQAKARELLSLELYNQTDASEALQRKLEEFSIILRQISIRVDRTNERMEQLSSRLYSDECLGFLILVFLAVQVLLVLRTKFIKYRVTSNVVAPTRPNPLSVCQTCPTRNSPTSSTNNNSGSPMTSEKKPSLKTEACLVLFNNFKPNQQQMAPLLAACSKNSDETKLSLKTAYVINSEETVHQCPTAKIYLVAVNSHLGNSSKVKNVEGKEGKSPQVSRSHSGHHLHQKAPQPHASDMELLKTFLRKVKTNGGQVLLVVVNDDSSTKLPNSSLYSTNHPLILANELLSELAFNGRICTVWQEFSLFQLNHVKKVFKSLSNVNSK